MVIIVQTIFYLLTTKNYIYFFKIRQDIIFLTPHKKSIQSFSSFLLHQRDGGSVALKNILSRIKNQEIFDHIFYKALQKNNKHNIENIFYETPCNSQVANNSSSYHEKVQLKKSCQQNSQYLLYFSSSIHFKIFSVEIKACLSFCRFFFFFIEDKIFFFHL